MYNIAHRGASGIAPENTLLALSTAIQAGADMVEFDVQITKDKKLVLFHDKTLERITGESKMISDFNLDQIKKKDVGVWKDQGFVNIFPPSLEEALEFLPEKYSMLLEIKPQGVKIEDDFALERLVLNYLDDFGKLSGVGNGYISVRTESAFEFISSNTKKYKVGLMQKKRNPNDFIKIIDDYNIPYAQMRTNNFADNDYKLLKETGTKIIAFWGDDPLIWNYLIKMDVTGIITNFPSLLSGFLSLHNSKN